MNIISTHSDSNLAHSFDIHRLINFARNANLLWMFLFGVSYYVNVQCTSKSDQLITIYGEQKLSWNVIYFISEFKITCKNGDFECRCIRTHSEKPSKIYNITFNRHFAFFSLKHLTELLS